VGDLLCSNVDPAIFITYIGFNIAAFAFLCQYLVFPKTLLTDISNMICHPPPRITDQRVVQATDEHVGRIICFFYEIDTITFTLLVYILYSIAVILMLLGVLYAVLQPPAARTWIIVLTGMYATTILFLVFREIFRTNKEARKMRRNFYWTSRWCYGILELVLLAILCYAVYYILYVHQSGMLLFLFLILFLAILFAWYLSSIALKQPVRAILARWLSNKACEKVKVEPPRDTSGEGADVKGGGQ